MRAEAGRTGRLTAITSSNDPFLFPPRCCPPHLLALHTISQLEKERLEKNAKGFAGGGTGRRNSGFRRVDDYRGTYETVGRIEKLVDELGYRVPLRPLFFRK